MNFYEQRLYKEFEEFLFKGISSKASVIVLTLPGLGAYHFSKKFVEKNKSLGISYIEKEGESLESFNFLGFDLYKNTNSLEVVDGYFSRANISQKFAVILNQPWIVDTLKYKNLSFQTHVYSTFFFRTRNEEETKSAVFELDEKITKSEVEKIFSLSGGIIRIVKFLVFNKDILNKKVEEILTDSGLVKSLTPTLDAVLKCNDQTLLKLGLKDNNLFRSEILEKYFELNPQPQRIDITVNSDLSFKEDSILSKGRLTKTDSLILSAFLEADHFVSKEKVAEIKWGKGSYEEYSDQAVGKTMQRFGKKLTNYRIEVVPKVGYKIVKKNG